MANLLVIVSYKVFPAQMGGQKGIVKFYEHLQKHHSINLMVSFDNETEKVSLRTTKLLYANRKMTLNLFWLFTLLQKIKNEKVDCVIAEHSYTGWMALLLKKLSGKPFIIHSHNIEANRFRHMGRRGWKLYQRYEGWIHRNADFNFFKTEEERETAIQQYSLPGLKCAVAPYGIEKYRETPCAREKVEAQYGIKSTYLFYFNGTLDYSPNVDAVETLIETINPMLKKTGIDYTLLISGNRIMPALQKKIESAENIRYIGFAENVELLYQASTLFLNPVVNDSGVKTKVIEALANQCTIVSTKSGATGISKKLCGDKLKLVEDKDWDGFVKKIMYCLRQPFTETPPAFFDYFSWTNIAETAAKKIDAISHA